MEYFGNFRNTSRKPIFYFLWKKSASSASKLTCIWEDGRARCGGWRPCRAAPTASSAPHPAPPRSQSMGRTTSSPTVLTRLSLIILYMNINFKKNLGCLPFLFFPLYSSPQPWYSLPLFTSWHSSPTDFINSPPPPPGGEIGNFIHPYFFKSPNMQARDLQNQFKWTDCSKWVCLGNVDDVVEGVGEGVHLETSINMPTRPSNIPASYHR